MTITKLLLSSYLTPKTLSDSQSSKILENLSFKKSSPFITILPFIKLRYITIFLAKNDKNSIALDLVLQFLSTASSLRAGNKD